MCQNACSFCGFWLIAIGVYIFVHIIIPNCLPVGSPNGTSNSIMRHDEL
jgi:hypothetical protein